MMESERALPASAAPFAKRDGARGRPMGVEPMNRKTIARMTAALAGVILAGGLLAGCMSPNTGATDQQQANRTYMTQVNRAMEDLNGRLAGFDEAVAQGNPVNMRAKADDAFAAIDDLAAIETPDAMKDLQKGYVDGCTALKDALNGYVDLYTEIDSATEEHPFDFGTYDDRIKAVQDKYNEGVNALKAADEEALKLNED
jgi:outer membrane murein-binding lipoprotein Lpp